MAKKLYKKLISLYPRDFRDRFGGSMEQTFDDLCTEWAKNSAPSFGLLLWVFADTVLGIVREHISGFRQRIFMRETLINPMPAAVLSIFLFLPLGLPLLIFLTDIGPLVRLAQYLLTTDGQQVSAFGRIVLASGMLLLPMAFLLNVVPMFARVGAGGKISFRPRAVNVITGAAIFLVVVKIGSWMIFETVNCSKGICD